MVLWYSSGDPNSACAQASANQMHPKHDDSGKLFWLVVSRDQLSQHSYSRRRGAELSGRKQRIRTARGHFLESDLLHLLHALLHPKVPQQQHQQHHRPRLSAPKRHKKEKRSSSGPGPQIRFSAVIDHHLAPPPPPFSTLLSIRGKNKALRP